MVRRSKRALNIEMAKSGPCREFYEMGRMHGFQEGMVAGRSKEGMDYSLDPYGLPKKKKRKLNSWQKFVKANAKKPRFRSMNNTARLKKLGIAYRKTAAYKRNKKK